MSLYGLAMCSHDDPDPWLACHWGVTDHPHYHDCVNCIYGVHCDYGRINLLRFVLDVEKEETDRIIKEISDFCNTDYELKSACHVPHVEDEYF